MDDSEEEEPQGKRREGKQRNKRARLEMNHGEKRGMGRQGSPRSANRSWDQAGGRKGIHLRRRTALTCLGLRFSYWDLREDAGQRSERNSPVLNRSIFRYAGLTISAQRDPVDLGV